jgi:hypothetical protein
LFLAWIIVGAATANLRGFHFRGMMRVPSRPRWGQRWGLKASQTAWATLSPSVCVLSRPT